MMQNNDEAWRAISPRKKTVLCMLFFFWLLFTACANDEGEDEALSADPLVIGVLMALPSGASEGFDELTWAVEKVNEAGGILGRHKLELRYVDIAMNTEEEALEKAQTLAVDDEVIAVIGTNNPSLMMGVATIMANAQKPIISYTVSSGEVLRAFSGSPFVWRTRMTDIAQAEWLVKESRKLGAQTVGLLTSLDDSGISFFDWFGFYARLEGYNESDIFIENYGDDRPLEEATAALIDTGVERVIFVPQNNLLLKHSFEVFDTFRSPEGKLPLQIVYADTGIDVNKSIEEASDKARDLEGWTATYDERSGFAAAWEARFGSPQFSNTAPAGHDAILLLAYGLEASKGEGGAALADGISAVVSGRGAAVGSDAAGIASALKAIRTGELPDISGATGALEYDPEIGVDLISGIFAHWTTKGPLESREGLYDLTAPLGGEGEASPGLLRAPDTESFVPPEAGADVYVPASETPSRTLALVISASEGWDNYRHQADALAVYERLRAGGLTDDDIIMVGIDDLAKNNQNPLPDVVRNIPAGTNLYESVVYDYNTISAEQVSAILLGQSNDSTPQVLQTDAETNLLIFMVGHGGSQGLALGATTTAEGLSGGSSVLEPSLLRQTLCTLREEDRVRRVLVLIESCYSGVFGSAEFSGLELGCDSGPLTGTLLITAAGTDENSLGVGYDREIAAWVGDEFSVAVNSRLDQSLQTPLLDLYREVYLSVPGSHVGAYNADTYGDLQRLSSEEFFVAP